MREEIVGSPCAAWSRQAHKAEWATLKYFESGDLIIEGKDNKFGLPENLTEAWKLQINLMITEGLGQGEDLLGSEDEGEEAGEGTLLLSVDEREKEL